VEMTIPYAKILRKYDNMFNNNRSISNHNEIENYTKVYSKACQEELKHYDVVFCTTAVATNPRFLRATKGKIYQLIIDEAGMCIINVQFKLPLLHIHL
jgi:superfamily I DNA and/or RNA helicase